MLCIDWSFEFGFGTGMERILLGYGFAVMLFCYACHVFGLH